VKAILNPRKNHSFKKFSFLLIAVALVAGILSCDGVTVQYDLTIASTDGGMVTDPAEGTHTYDARTVVNLVATPDCGYAFHNWTGDTDNVADVNAATTNITMSADYSITANFVPLPPDHYKFYYVYWDEPEYMDKEVLLEDQFGAFNATVMEAALFGNPVEKGHPGMPLAPISNENRHYTLYWLDMNEEDWVTREVEISNQFNDAAEPQTLTVYGPVMLAVPTQKEGHEMVDCLNHYLLYWVDELDQEEFEPVEGVNLKDQFIPDGEDTTIQYPLMFANPVQKTIVGGDVAEVEYEDLHWVLYWIYDPESPSIDKSIQIANQFGNNQVLEVTLQNVLAVPSQKIVPPTPPLDHFKCYPAFGPPLGEAYADLEDQFGNYVARVMGPAGFWNPVDKVHAGGTPTNRNDDNHFTVYILGEIESSWWSVTVKNQFGNDQELIVEGPVALAVPTQKLYPGDHDIPKYLDHYLLYKVWIGSNVTATVDLNDQFPLAAPDVEVTKPEYFATPAIKGYLDHEPGGFWNAEGHLVLYAISSNEEFLPAVVVSNQFQEELYLELSNIGELLAVPSLKIAWEPFTP
jgi:hypothetical protein